MALHTVLALAALALVAPAAAQESIDSLPSLSVAVTSDSPHIYRDSEGRVTVAGEVENRDPLTAMSEVVVRATFYGEGGQEIVEVVRGVTLLDIVPSEGSSPYVIRSISSDPRISQVSVDVESFDSSPPRVPGLEVSVDNVRNSGDISVSGEVRSSFGAPSGAAEAHLLFYDVFDPPRLLQVETLPLGGIPAGGSVPFEFSGAFDSRAVKFSVIAESGVLVSDPAESRVPAQENLPPARMVGISGVSADSAGGRAEVGSEVVFSSTLQFRAAPGDRIQPFVYFVQVKQLGQDAFVEFVGSYEGAFYNSPSEKASVSWVPDRAGNYFVETFVWDESSAALAPAGPTALVRVN